MHRRAGDRAAAAGDPKLEFTLLRLYSLLLEGHGDDASLVLVTHVAADAALAATVEDLRGLDVVRAVASVMRVEGEQL